VPADVQGEIGGRWQERGRRGTVTGAARAVTDAALAHVDAAAALERRRAHRWTDRVGQRRAEPGELGVFIDEAQVANLEKKMNERGYLEGSEMAGTFNLLRANDLIWSFVVNNYLLGKDPFPFDLLYWNADSTNLPGPMYCWYLRKTYLENKLRVPGATSVLGVPVDFGRIDLPAYVLATREDHIVPWRTAYQTTQLIKGDRRFVLGASGHVAGVINPASKNKRSYWVNDKLPATAKEWFDGASEKPGSWWNDWSAWLKTQGGPMVAAPKSPGNRKHKAIEPAPGRYVKQKA